VGLASLILVPAVETAAWIGVAWVRTRRNRYRRRGVELTAEERKALAAHFEPALLDAVRVCRVPRIEPALPSWLMRLLRLPPSVDISAAAGMAFGDAVVIADVSALKTRPLSLLFHELVHCVQYRTLGTRRFLRCYLRGWTDSGFDYFSIPLEQQAYHLHDRFDSGEVFCVSEVVAAELARLKYP
jgi:hypothetical protein